MKKIVLALIFGSAILLFSCGEQEATIQNSLPPQAAFDSLISYIERSGDVVNGPDIPALISAPELYYLLDSSIYIIDTRTTEEFADAHIPGSVNVQFTQLLDYFENKIDPNSFKDIVLVCNAGQTASYATSILRLLGYDNVYSLRWGFSSWHEETAGKRWVQRASNKYSELLERTSNIKNQPGEYPVIQTDERFGYTILRERAHKLFSQGFNSITVDPDTLFYPDNNFYIINYWPIELYNIGHIPRAIQYQPKSSLKRNNHLNTLPTDKPIVVYCYTGQHSSFVTAYLRLLGYDARTLIYGANGFMHGVMVKQNLENTFSKEYMLDLPVSSGGALAQPKNMEVVATQPRGGC
jgi:rhodanese-related sulfurtransferase